MYKLLTWMLVVISFVLIASGCSIQDDKDSEIIKSNEKVEITLTFAGGDTSWNRSIDLAVKGFMDKYPNIVIHPMYGSAESGLYGDYLKKLDAVGELGDLVEISNADSYAANNRIVPLPKELTDLVKYRFEVDGIAYSLSTVESTQGIVYNKEIFEQLGIEEPQTYSEFIQICEDIEKYKLLPIVVGGRDLWHMGFWINHFFRSDVLVERELWIEDRNASLVSWNDDAPRRMMHHIKDLFQSGYINSDFETVADSETASYIASGQAVMLYSGPWMFKEILELNEELDLGWLYLPNEDGQKVVLQQLPQGFAITKECSEDEDKYQAAIEFLKYFYSMPNYRDICERMSALGVTVEPVVYEGLEVNQKMQDDFDDPSSMKTTESIGSEKTPEGFRNVMYTSIIKMINDEYSVDEVLDLLDKEWDELNTVSN